MAGDVIPAVLSRRAAEAPAHLALVVDDLAELRVRDWDTESRTVARALASHVSPGDRVGLLFANDELAAYAVAYVAVQHAGAIAVPVGVQAGSRTIEWILRDSAPRLVVHGAHTPPAGPWEAVALDDLGNDEPLDLGSVPIGEADVAQILYTSAVTGPPKGVAATHANLVWRLRRRPRPFAHSAVVLHAFPLGTEAAQTLLLDAMVSPATVLAVPSFDAARVCELVTTCGVESLALAPTMAADLVDSPGLRDTDTSRVRLVSSTGAPLTPALARRLARAFANATIVNHYSSTEAAPAATTMIVSPRRPRSVGRPAEGCGIRVTDADGRAVEPGAEGFVWLRARDAPPRTYWDEHGASAAPADDGWIKTGDIGYVDQDGYLFLVDREHDIVNRGGTKVSTQRLEALLAEHPDVRDAAVFGVPHPTLGQMLVAAIEGRAPGVDADGIRRFIAAEVAPHEVPHPIMVLPHIPRGPTGKVDKRELRRLAAANPTGGRPTEQTPMQTTLLRIWRDVLGPAEIGLDDDFFALGGDSLRVVRLFDAIESELAVKLSASFVYEFNTVAAQARALERLTRSAPVEGQGLPEAV